MPVKYLLTALPFPTDQILNKNCSFCKWIHDQVKGFFGMKHTWGEHLARHTHTPSLGVMYKQTLPYTPGNGFLAIFSQTGFAWQTAALSRWHLFSVKCFLFPELRYWHHAPPSPSQHLCTHVCQLKPPELWKETKQKFMAIVYQKCHIWVHPDPENTAFEIHSGW